MSGTAINFEGIELVAEKAGELDERIVRIEHELAAQTKTLESASAAISAAITALGAFKRQTTDARIGAWQSSVNARLADLESRIR